MKLHKCIISGFLAIAIIFSLSVPAFAVDTGLIVEGMAVAPDFGSWVWSVFNGGFNIVGSLFDDDICPGSTEYSTRHNFVPQHTQVNGKTGMFYICENCGKSAGEVLEPAYDDYVQTLPATGYTSTGGMIWYPTWADVCNPSYGLPLILEDNTPNPSSRSFSFNFRHDASLGFGISFKNLPVNGLYRAQEQFICHYQYLGDTAQIEVKTVESNNFLEWFRRSLTDTISSFSMTARYPMGCYVSAELILPSFEVVPDTIVSENTYSSTTRPTSITGGNYGIIGDNGQITKVEDNSTIVNETNNTYYNPATGQTVPITNWSYDYSDRSYKVDYTTTNTTGDTVTNTSTITYGDEYITITEIDNSQGDTITNNYTIYYLIEGTGSETPPSVCEHVWTETSTTPATCTLPGSKLLTCSKYQQTKKAPIPALGHDWQVKQSVTTEYDDTGQLIQEGYTFYECSRCKEQYKSASGTSPPTNPSDPDASGEGVFSGIFGLLLDFLSFFWKTFKDFTSSGVKAFLDALKDGTSDIFGLLNPFDWSA